MFGLVDRRASVHLAIQGDKRISHRNRRNVLTRLTNSREAPISARRPSWLVDVLRRINDHNIQNLDQPLPWKWRATSVALTF
jgi:hypothetical protein